MVHKTFSRETEVQVPPKKLWTVLVLRPHDYLPLLMKDVIAGVEYQGKALEIGVVRVVKFHKSVNGLHHVKHRLEEIDHEKLRVKFSVVEGGLAAVFKDVKIEIEFKEGELEETSIMKKTTEYEADEELQELPEEYPAASLALLKSAEAYLLQHNQP